MARPFLSDVTCLVFKADTTSLSLFFSLFLCSTGTISFAPSSLQTMKILKDMFLVANEVRKRVLMFANHDDLMSFRRHTFRRDKRDR